MTTFWKVYRFFAYLATLTLIIAGAIYLGDRDGSAGFVLILLGVLVLTFMIIADRGWDEKEYRRRHGFDLK